MKRNIQGKNMNIFPGIQKKKIYQKKKGNICLKNKKNKKKNRKKITYPIQHKVLV